MAGPYYELFRLADVVAEDDGIRSPEDVFEELISAFWRGDFEGSGPDVGPATVVLARHLNEVKHADNDHSFNGDHIGRVGLIDLLWRSSGMPNCGLAGSSGPLSGRQELLIWLATQPDAVVSKDLAEIPALTEMVGWTSAQAFAEVCGKLAGCRPRDYPAEGYEWLRSLAVDPRTICEWLACNERPVPEKLRRIAEPVSVKAARKRGRPRGSGSFDKDDEPLLDGMFALIQSKGISRSAAAEQVAASAKGAGTGESVAKRLTRKYGEKFG